MFSDLFIGCGESPNVPNANKHVHKTNKVDENLEIELEVSYTCINPFIKIPASANTNYNCLEGGTWSGEEFKCAKG